MVDKGDVDKALKLHQEIIEVFDELSDKDNRANTLWGMAQIGLQKKNFQEAYEQLAESYAINMNLERLEGICFVGLDLGNLLCAAGHKDDGIILLKRSREGFIKLRQPLMVKDVDQLISKFQNNSS